jgi:hypothetical protein
MFVMIRQHYVRVQNKLKEADILLHESMGQNDNADPLIPENKDRIAVILVGRSLGAGIHEMLTVTRLFPGIFHGFIFVSVGEVDMESFSGEESLSQLKDEVENVLDTLVKYCWARGFKADYEADYGVDVVQKLATLCDKIRQDFSNTIFFSTQLVFDNDTAILRMLHNQTSVALQRRLHLKGIPMMVLPMKI